jgi:ent-kaurene oxidase
MAILLTGLFVAVVLWIVRARLVARQKLQMPYLTFEGDNSPMRYIQESTKLLDIGYEKVKHSPLGV